MLSASPAAASPFINFSLSHVSISDFSYQPGPSVRPASREPLLEGPLELVVPELLEPGPDELELPEVFDTPGPPFSPVTPPPEDWFPAAGVCADTPFAFWHTPDASKL